MLDLKVKPSNLFISTNEEDEPVDFEWHCKSGLAVNIQLVKDEFNKERNLKPIKIFITGPPASGKSYYAKQLAEHYNVPHVHVGKLLQEIDNWNKEKEEEIFRKREIKNKLKEEENFIKN
jgi:predicted AAA+ superfamily ATPase